MKEETRGRGAKRRPPTISETSAGGVVLRRMGGRVHVALLRTTHARGEAWVLPKGHIERHHGETTAEAAVREVREELGIADVRLKRPLGTTRFCFSTPRGRVSKTVHYYLMDGRSEALRPQVEEGMLEARWVPVRDALARITYPTDRSVILRAVVRQRGTPRKNRRRNERRRAVRLK